jgi:RNA polymerase sigma factor (sigma-70 family)
VRLPVDDAPFHSSGEPHVPPRDLEISRWFSEEVSPHEMALRSYLRTHFPGLRDIDDLIHDIYARIMQARARGTIAETRPYLFSMARNAAIDLCRRNRLVSMEPIVETIHSPVVDDRPDPAETLCNDQELQLLGEAIRQLPERCRTVLTLRKLHGLSHRAIASRLEISENTVSAQITVGVFRVREYLLAHGVERDAASCAPRARAD